MKHFTGIMLLLFTIICFMVSCQNNNVKDFLVTMDNDAPTSETSVHFEPDQQESVADISDFFGNAIASNPIDALYNKDIEEGIKSFSEVTDSYTLMWKNEFKETLSLFRELCADDNEDIVSELESWSDSEQELWKWEQKTVFENSASTFGTQVYYEQLKQLGDSYREKTVWMKYMCFIRETGLDPSRYNDSLSSISFKASVTSEADSGNFDSNTVLD